jgi:hypothetical protein
MNESKKKDMRVTAKPVWSAAASGSPRDAALRATPRDDRRLLSVLADCRRLAVAGSCLKSNEVRK